MRLFWDVVPVNVANAAPHQRQACPRCCHTGCPTLRWKSFRFFFVFFLNPKCIYIFFLFLYRSRFPCWPKAAWEASYGIWMLNERSTAILVPPAQHLHHVLFVTRRLPGVTKCSSEPGWGEIPFPSSHSHGQDVSSQGRK